MNPPNLTTAQDVLIETLKHTRQITTDLATLSSMLPANMNEEQNKLAIELIAHIKNKRRV